MQSYLIRRLTPFFIFSFLLEFIFAVSLSWQNYSQMDWSFMAMVKMLGVLVITTTVAFLYMAVPYVLYLMLLPKHKQNSRLDKIVTITFFTIFVFANVFEEVASWVFWDEFSAAFNFIAVDYLVYTTEVIANIYQSYPVNSILIALALITFVIVWSCKRFLFTGLEAPKFGKRFFHTVIYCLICVLAYLNVDMSKLDVNHNYYNNEIAKEGTYSLFSAFLKNELPYDTFYITHNPKDNLEILQNKFNSENVTFVSPKKNISRQISSFKPENRANVVIVLMESMSSKFLDENRPKGAKIITPNLSKLAKEGLFFSNTYATGTRSVRGIEALTLGVPPLPGMSIVRRPNNENLHNIGSIFKAKGYDNKWIYGGYGYFDNMNYFFGNNGFAVVDRAAWQEDEVTFANAWGAADEDTFAKVIKEADKSYEQDKPFFTILLTISNHRPYTYPDGRIDLPSKIARREGGVKYADYAIGKFIEDAKKKPWFDNTVFVFVADHTAGAAGNEEINLEGHHIPAIIYAPKMVKAQRVDTPISQVDVLPTLLGLLNFNYESRFYGQDALRKDYESRFFVSNYQKVGYVKNGVDLILKPVKDYSYEPLKAKEKVVNENLSEAVAFYQQASDWVSNLKEK